jgi:hypothetical protein
MSSEIECPDSLLLPLLQSLKLSSVTILSLPQELHLEISSYLTPLTTQFLRQSCRYFYNLLPPLPKHSDLQATLPELLVFERLPHIRSLSLFACSVCLRLRRVGQFADHLRKGRYDFDGNKREERFCIDCGMKKKVRGRRFEKGESWKRFGLAYVWCKTCRGKKRGAKGKGLEAGVCEQCWKK